jgi:hypothetical protein
MQTIFLTNDIEFISKTMLTNGWVKKNNAVVLKVNVELNEINSSAGWFKDNKDGVVSKEFRYFLNIEPSNIEVVKVNFKNFELEY